MLSNLKQSLKTFFTPISLSDMKTLTSSYFSNVGVFFYSFFLAFRWVVEFIPYAFIYFFIVFLIYILFSFIYIFIINSNDYYLFFKYAVKIDSRNKTHSTIKKVKNFFDNDEKMKNLFLPYISEVVHTFHYAKVAFKFLYYSLKKKRDSKVNFNLKEVIQELDSKDTFYVNSIGNISFLRVSFFFFLECFSSLTCILFKLFSFLGLFLFFNKIYPNKGTFLDSYSYSFIEKSNGFIFVFSFSIIYLILSFFIPVSVTSETLFNNVLSHTKNKKRLSTNILSQKQKELFLNFLERKNELVLSKKENIFNFSFTENILNMILAFFFYDRAGVKNFFFKKDVFRWANIKAPTTDDIRPASDPLLLNPVDPKEPITGKPAIGSSKLFESKMIEKTSTSVVSFLFIFAFTINNLISKINNFCFEQSKQIVIYTYINILFSNKEYYCIF